MYIVHAQASTVTPTPGSGEDDPVSDRKYKENFYASVSIPHVMQIQCSNYRKATLVCA